MEAGQRLWSFREPRAAPTNFSLRLTMGQLQELVQRAAAAVDLENMASRQARCPVQILKASFERPARLMLTSHDPLENVQAAEALKLAGNAIGFDRIELSQVTYADGTTWSPERRSCVYANVGVTERAKAG
jgi:hypothetical protein